jgi:uncharacterized protein (DUF305 family)
MSAPRLVHLLTTGAIVLTSIAPLENAKAQSTATAEGRTNGRPQYTPADVRFMQGMIAHHAQALVMTALLPERTARPDMHLLAQRIEVSQKDEIGLMRRWLQSRNQPVADMSDMSMPNNVLMPGMLTPVQLADLAKTKGPEFDRLFLQDMIRHHEGALVMVRDLLATNGAAQESQIFQFASDIDADQRAEIMRMRALLAASPAPNP